MNIAPPTNRPPEISVAEPISSAFDRVSQMLFNPFNLDKWFIIGFCAWLAGLGEVGGGFHSWFNSGHKQRFNSDGGDFQDQMRHVYHRTWEYLTLNLYWILPVVAMATILGLALWCVILWLNCRGKFMFLHCVALDRADISEPWERHGALANRLFVFRLVLAVIGWIIVLPLMAVMVISFGEMVFQERIEPVGVVAAIGAGLALFCVGLGLGLIRKLTQDFVVPIMYLRGGGCLEAWRELVGLLTNRPAMFILYFLMQIVLAIAIQLILMIVVLITCCTAGCLMLLPYLGTVFLLPVLIFKRSYSLYFLAQFGREFDVFYQPEPAASELPKA